MIKLTIDTVVVADPLNSCDTSCTYQGLHTLTKQQPELEHSAIYMQRIHKRLIWTSEVLQRMGWNMGY